jgi:RND family efflux transporter MFP subunit
MSKFNLSIQSIVSKPMRNLLIPVISTVAIAGTVWVWSNHRHVPAASNSLPMCEVRTSPVRINLLASHVTLAGVAEPIRRATPSARIMARVLAANFQEGQRVDANRILVRLDTRDLEAKHKQASASQDAASTSLEVAETNLRRMRSLAKAGAASQAQLEAVEVVAAQAQAATKTTRAAIDEVDVNVSYASVASPFAGVVVQKMTEAGNIVGPGQPLFIVEDDSRLRVVASIGTEDAINLAPNQRVHVRFGEESRDGILEGVMSSGDSRAPGQRVQILIDNPDHLLRAGSLAVVEIPRNGTKTRVMTIPKDAVIERGQLTGAFVVGADSIARLRWLVLGEAKDGSVPVFSGLSDGDRVVLSPTPDLSDGQLVRELSR